MKEYLLIETSPGLRGKVELEGAKNAVLVIMASLILTAGKSRLTNVPASSDVYTMIALLQELGAVVVFESKNKILEVDTSDLYNWRVSPDIIKKIRASILVMGPLLARFGKVEVAMPGGDAIGTRPIDLHLKAFAKMGAIVDQSGDGVAAYAPVGLRSVRCVLDYPSVGATENILMAAVLAPGVTEIVNAALEPEVLDLITVLQKMGADVTCQIPATLRICGVQELKPIEHSIMFDRLEAGTLLLAVAATGGQLSLPQAPVQAMDVFLEKMNDMGHSITIDQHGSLHFKATMEPRAISFKTMPYPGYPTDLQAPMLAALCLAHGTSMVHETVYESRMLHVQELQKMGAQIDLRAETVRITGVARLSGTCVVGHDIRAAAALIIAGLAAQGKTIITGVPHIRRGYHGLDKKLQQLGARIEFVQTEEDLFLQNSSRKISQLTSN